MSGLLRTLVRVMLLRQGPQDLTWSPTLATVSIVAYGLLTALSVMLRVPRWDIGLAMGAAEASLLAIYLHGILRWWRYPARYPQTLLAAAGSGCLFTLAGIPLVLATTAAQQGGADQSTNLLLWLLLASWSFAVLIHIVRQALGCALHTSVALNLLYLLVSFQINRWLLALLAFDPQA